MRTAGDRVSAATLPTLGIVTARKTATPDAVVYSKPGRIRQCLKDRCDITHFDNLSMTIERLSCRYGRRKDVDQEISVPNPMLFVIHTEAEQSQGVRDDEQGTAFVEEHGDADAGEPK